MRNPSKPHLAYRQLCALALMLVCLCLLLNQPLAQAQGGGGFDHAATAFPLLGSHEQVRCETCHIKGIFKSTPKACASCHVVGNQRDAVAMSAKHIPTTLACDACHNVSSFSAVQFNHSMVQPGFCQVCHDGSRAKGLSVNHLATGGLSCDSCHTTVAFTPLPQFPHTILNGDLTTCVNCHDGHIAKGMAANHLPRSNPAQCGSCHINSTLNGFMSFSGGQMDHTGMTTGCADCHGPSITGGSFAGVSSIVVMPPTSPAGPNSHLPTSTTCESCHLGSLPVGLIAANASHLPPSSGFAAPAPSNAQIHAGVTGGCSSCHETNAVWMGVGAYPITPSSLVDKAQYMGFQTRPVTVPGNYSVADPAHPSGGDCSQCHSGTNYFSGAGAKPANHIPTAAVLCSACHTTPGDWTTLPTLANIHANSPSTSANCAQCHGAAAASFAIPASGFTIVGLPSTHIPASAACESCHVGAGSSMAATPVGNGAKFSGSLMSHTGITNNCEACHGPSITGASFAGVSKIVVMPATSPMGASSHIPSSATCETCHLASMPAGMVPASSSKTAPGTLFATPAPTTAQIHTGITGSCSSCHETNSVWMGMNAYPIAPSVLTSGAQYTGFHSRPVTAPSSFSVADAGHPGSGDCSQCHTGTAYFSGTVTPANHIPYANTAQCTACHTSTDYSVMPTLANIHANAPSTSSNCAQCHGSAAASFAIPAANFTIVGLPATHIPTSAACESCHVGAGSSIAATPVGNGAKFSGSLMSHSGITSNCVACHGPSITGASFVGVSKIVVMPASSPAGASSHIPSSTTCESCHLGSTPAGMVPASSTRTAPGTLFATPAPTTAQIHNGVTSGCSSCHDTSMVWMGMNAYPIAPSVLTSGAQYTGFHSRPVTAASSFSVADAAHPTTGDCSQCHTGSNYFSSTPTPANHIPYAAAAQCNACHTSADYSAMPTLANIHANAPSTSSNCAQCHGSAAASFAILSANFTIVGLPATHIPTSAACESCHVGAGSSIAATPVGNGAKFSGSLMSHSGITSNCVACHGPTITGASFAGVGKIVVMPATSPAGASSHIPSSTTCESCHLGTTPAGMVAASATKTAPGTLFATPAPTTAQIHSGVTSGCSSCHDTSMVWMGMNAYPIAPSVLTSGAQYTGFHSRPVTAASSYSVADAAHPGSGDCSQCHTGTSYFSGVAVPANHIPYAGTAQCTACHTSTDYSAMPTLANIHANAPSTSSNCAQCHAAAVVAGFAIPAANFAIVGPPATHIPTSAACESCHVGAGSSIAATPVGNGAKFSGSLMSHSGITSNCVACHGPSITGASFVGVGKIVVMPATSPAGASSHIPSSTTCESCHLGTTPAGMVAASATKTAPGTLFATPAPTTAQIHSGVTSGCSGCHDTSMVWMGMSAYPIAPSVLTSGAQYTGFHSRPVTAAGSFSVADAAHPGSGDCSQCHTGTSYFSGVAVPANHIPYAGTAQCTACHTSTDYSAMPTLANIHANAPSTSSNCAQCHAAAVVAGFAIPAANFTIVGLPATHIPTSAACEACHVGTGSSIAVTPVPNGAKFSGSLMSHSGITSNCVACHGPTITGASFAGISKIVVMPAVTPMGSSAHIPSSTTCETCHLGTTPAGMVAASATKTAPGTAFLNPAPTTAQIHTGITSGCSSCHDTGYVWMGMGSYPIAPTVLTTGAQYTGFHARPMTTAGTYTVADAAHPTTGDCSQCHTGTAYFTGIAKPTGHMPTTLACATCHIVAGDYSVAGLASNTILHTGISTGCISCHTAGTGAGPFAGCATQAACASPPPVTYQPKVMPLLAGGSATAPSASTHVPSVGIKCELCHSPTVFTAFSGMNMKSNTPAHTAVGTATCESCHDYPYVWYGVTIKTPGSSSHHGRKAGQDCVGSGCHSKSYGSFGGAARVRPVLRGAVNTINQRFLPGVGLIEGDASVFSHAGVAPGQCQTCHNGQVAQGLPPVHLQVRMSCDSCHRSTAWKPAQFSHQGVLPGQCQLCHNSAAATGRPAGHFVTSRSCDACHRTVAWLPVSYAHISPLHQAQPGNPTCMSCHITNGELIPRQMRGNNRPKPVPVHTGP